jgi:hypothetical protein
MNQTISTLIMKKIFYFIAVSILFFSCTEEQEGLFYEEFGLQEGEVIVTFNGTTETGVVFENETFTFNWYNLLTQNSVSISSDGNYYNINLNRYDTPYYFDSNRNFTECELQINQNPESDYYGLVNGSFVAFVDEAIDNQSNIRFLTYSFFDYDNMIFSQFDFNKDTYQLKASGSYTENYSDDNNPVIVTIEIDVQLYKVIKSEHVNN